MADEEEPLTVIEMLTLLPEGLVQRVVDDDAFRAAIGLDLPGMLTLDGGAIALVRRSFFAAIRTLYTDGLAETPVTDEAGKVWALTAGERDGRRVLTLVRSDDRRELHGFVALHPDSLARLAEFDAALAVAGLPADALADWRARLTERPLGNEEMRHLDAALAHTPAAIARDIERQLAGPTGKTETMVPPHRDYYDHLIGAGIATSVADLADTILVPHIARLLGLEGGAQRALLLGAHASIIAASGLPLLPEDELLALLRWAAQDGDTLSRVAAIETGIAALARVPAAESLLIPLVESVRDLDPDDKESRLSLLMACILFVGGELSRLKILDDLPPFQRRLAIFAQAALFERQAYGRLGVEHFTKWATSERGQSFYYQTLTELRIEPRWMPDYASPEQLKAECIGRIHNVAAFHAAAIPGWELRDLLFGAGPDSIATRLVVPGSFLPGPLEGTRAGPGQPMPEAWNEILDETLSAATFKPSSVAALINLRGLFTIGGDRVDRAVELIKSAGHRLDPDVDQDTRENLFSGLAALAAATRNVALADELRVMVRKNRVDAQDPPRAQREFMIAVVAAAAHCDFAAWADFIGNWGSELAFGIDDKDEAGGLLGDMSLLCLIEPPLRRTLGAPMAALDAFLGTAN
jgi:hypothetical protein